MEDQFDLCILDTGDPARAITVARSGLYDTVIGACASPVPIQPLTEFQARLLKTATGDVKQRPTPQELEDFGHKLFKFVVHGDVQALYERLPGSHVRFQIYSNRPDLQGIAWEYIRRPGTIVPDSTRSVVRVIPTFSLPPFEPLRAGKALRMLLVHAEPVREDSVPWEEIEKATRNEFEAQLPKGSEIDIVDGVNRPSFLTALDEKRYDILHFVGHGEVDQNGTGTLVFVNRRTQEKDLVTAHELAVVLRNKQLNLVVLSSCNSAAGDFARRFAVVAKTLVESGVPAVVANQFPISYSEAAAFAGPFYKELLKSGDVDRAMTEARVALSFVKPAGVNVANIAFGIPVLYRRAGAAKIFAP
jgi:hypothetical protein